MAHVAAHVVQMEAQAALDALHETGRWPASLEAALTTVQEKLTLLVQMAQEAMEKKDHA